MGQEQRAKRKWTLLGSYSYLDLWIPSKMGMTAAYNPDSTQSWEFEYLQGSISFPFFVDDLGKFTDQRFSLLKRSYSERNSFNFVYGVYYSSIEVFLGADLLSKVSNAIPKYDLIEVQTLGATWGLGSRWQFSSGWAIGVDWFVLNIPLVTLKSNAPFTETNGNAQDKENVKKALDVFKKIPTAAIFKFQIGGSF